MKSSRMLYLLLIISLVVIYYKYQTASSIVQKQTYKCVSYSTTSYINNGEGTQFGSTSPPYSPEPQKEITEEFLLRSKPYRPIDIRNKIASHPTL